MQRYVFSDVARGLAILYIIQCHVLNIHFQWIDTWAMPVFFVIMGMFFKPTTSWREMVIKKSHTILLPFVILSVPSFIQYAYQLSFLDFLKRIIDPFNCIHGVGWFLVCMFWCYLIYYGIHRIAKGNIYRKLAISLIISVVFFYLSTWRPEFAGGHRLVLPYFLSTSLTCMSLIAMGEILREQLKKSARQSRVMFLSCTIIGGGDFVSLWMRRRSNDSKRLLRPTLYLVVL